MGLREIWVDIVSRAGQGKEKNEVYVVNERAEETSLLV